jgi:two-component system nitrate/nitrite response regulator NarL
VDTLPPVHVDAPTLYADLARVVVAAGDPVVRRALARAVASRFEGPAVRAVATLDDATGELDAIVWDLGADEDAARDRLAAHALPPAPVLALLGGATLARAAAAWGARALLLRDVDDDTLAAALRAAVQGLAVVSPSLLADALAAPPDAPKVTGDVTLTAREREVLELVAEGFSNKLAAQRLGISEHTVKFHVNGVMERLGAATRTEAVVRAARRGLLTL